MESWKYGKVVWCYDYGQLTFKKHFFYEHVNLPSQVLDANSRTLVHSKNSIGLHCQGFP